MQKIKLVAGCYVTKDDKLLLVEEAKPHIAGLLSIPAGGVEEGESFLDAAIREVLEETGFIVKPTSIASIENRISKRSGNHIIIVMYHAEILGTAASYWNHEIKRFDFFPIQTIKKECIAMPEKFRVPESILTACETLERKICYPIDLITEERLTVSN